MKMALVYIGDGYLAAAANLDLHPEAEDEHYYSHLNGEDGFELCTANIPDEEMAQNLLKQGSSDQYFSDGYEAANAVAKYLATEK